MARTGGHRKAGQTPRALGRMLAWLAGAALGSAAWWLLVRVAIDAGRDGRAGDSQAWWLLGGASVGAMACLLVALGCLWRLLVAAGVVSDYQPKRARGR